MIQPSTLNIIIIGASMLIFSFLWRVSAAWLAQKNSGSPVAKAMGAVYS